MITLYTWGTPNGHKVSIALAELDLPHRVVAVDISKGEQRDPAFLAINPNNKIPAIVDEEGVDGRTVVFESGAILLHLAEKTGRLLPRAGQVRADALEWLFWASSGLGPMLGQWSGFLRADPPNPAALAKFTDEAVRLFGVLERRLEHGAYVAGDYGVADIAAWTWTAAVEVKLRAHAGEALGPTPNIDRWIAEIAARPAVKRGMTIP